MGIVIGTQWQKGKIKLMERPKRWAAFCYRRTCKTKGPFFFRERQKEGRQGREGGGGRFAFHFHAAQKRSRFLLISSISVSP